MCLKIHLYFSTYLILTNLAFHMLHQEIWHKFMLCLNFSSVSADHPRPHLLIFDLLLLQKALQVLHIVVFEVFDEAAWSLQAFLNGETRRLVAEKTTETFSWYSHLRTSRVKEAVLCGEAAGCSRILHKDDVPSLGVRWDSAGDGGEAIRVDNGLLCSHELGQSLL